MWFMPEGTYRALTPQVIVSAVERAYGITLDGTITPYPSYVNRVYGLRSDDGTRLVVKFYRPGRWTEDAILEEHDFLRECAEAEIPVVAPLKGSSGHTLSEVSLNDEDDEAYLFALFPLAGGRNFDAEQDEQWFRLGGIVGRTHQVGKRHGAPNRLMCSPSTLTAGYVDELLNANLVHPEKRDEFEQVCRTTIDLIQPLFEDASMQRVHGDCHRGNILDRVDEGLLIIDFDDMMIGPPVQDIWLLLPDYAHNCRRELLMLLEGYEQFAAFERRSLSLIEPLRFMRMIYFLAWQARQRDDFAFAERYPGWGTGAFWLREIEDLSTQFRVISDHWTEDGILV